VSIANAVWARLTWPWILAAQAVGFAVALVDSLMMRDQKLQIPIPMVEVHFIACSLMALIIVPATLWADEAVRRGARPIRAYALALVSSVAIALSISTLIGACHLVNGHIQFYMSAELAKSPDGRSRPLSLTYCQDALNFLLYGGLPLLFHANRQAARRILERLRNVEAQRTRLERQLLESRLAAAEAQMDPVMLLASLAEIKGDFERSAPEADTKLANLIRKLRLSLSHALIANEPEADQP
jgi:hypothetical protein